MHKYHGTCESTARSLQDFCAPRLHPRPAVLFHTIFAFLPIPPCPRVSCKLCVFRPSTAVFSCPLRPIAPVPRITRPCNSAPSISYPAGLPPCPLSRIEDKASAARCATPFRYATPTKRPDQLNSQSHPDQDQHAVCTPSLLHFPLSCRSLRHYSLHLLTTPTTGVLTLAGTPTAIVSLAKSSDIPARLQLPLSEPSCSALHRTSITASSSPSSILGLHSLADRIAPSESPSTLGHASLTRP